MRKISLMILMIFVIFFAVNFSAFGDEKPAPEKAKDKPAETPETPAKTCEVKLIQHPGLPKFSTESFFSFFSKYKVDVLQKLDKTKLTLPEALIDPVFGSIKHIDKPYFMVISRDKKDGKYTQLYFDKDADLNLAEETPVKSYMNYKNTDMKREYAYFETFNIPVGENQVGVHLQYFFSVYQPKDGKSVRYEYFKYTICQYFAGKIKLGEKAYDFAIIDQKADGKLDFGTDFELWFIDVNADGKFDMGYNNPEIISSTDFMLGGHEISAKFDIEKLQAHFTFKDLVLGEVNLGIKDAKDACLYVARSASHWGQQYKVDFKDGIGQAPIGKLMLRQLEFTKDNKRNKLFYRTYTRKDKVEISKDKPFELKLDLVFQIKEYPREIKDGKKHFIMMGYVFDRRKYNDAEHFTRVQLHQNDKEIKPCDFIIKNSAGDVVSKGTGYFC